VRGQLDGVRGESALPRLAQNVLAGRSDPYQAADELLAALAAGEGAPSEA
jgi:LAO/AO transport system kinase